MYPAEGQMNQMTAEIHQINMFNNHQSTKILFKIKWSKNMVQTLLSNVLNKKKSVKSILMK